MADILDHIEAQCSVRCIDIFNANYAHVSITMPSAIVIDAMSGKNCYVIIPKSFNN